VLCGGGGGAPAAAGAPGEAGWVFTLDPDHVGIETFDDLVGQIAWSHHWFEVDGRLVRQSAPYRYVWPSELDLMAKITGSGSGTAGRAGTGRRSPPTAAARSRCSRNCRSRQRAQIWQIRPPELISARMLMAVQNGGYTRGGNPLAGRTL